MSEPAVCFQDFEARYGDKIALNHIDLEIPQNCIYALIGPSGCGKTTLLRSINRMNDGIASFKTSGTLLVNDQDVYKLKQEREIENLRRGIGMIFQQPNPLPASIYHNMALPILEHYKVPHAKLQEIITTKLRKAAIYDEVRDKIHQQAMTLSGGQQQRLCIARALMLDPQLMLFDEPCSALDPIATFAIEELLMDLKQSHTIIIVTHNMEQAQRIADYTAYFYLGNLVEYGQTKRIFQFPVAESLKRYVTGRGV